MRFFISFLLLSFCLPFSGHSQTLCNFEGLSTTVVDCAQGQFYVQIDFEYFNVPSDSFKVRGGGQVYGTFAYSNLPVTIGPLAANGSTAYEFVVADVQLLQACSAVTPLNPVSCDTTSCEIYDLTVLTGDCNADGTYNATVNFLVQHPSNLKYSIWLNNTLYGSFNLADLPLHIAHFPTNPGPNDLVKVCINDNPNCCKILEFPVPICGSDSCEIYDLTVLTGDCNADGTYNATVNFLVQHPSNQHFDIWLNNAFYGYFGLADLPLHIAHFPTNPGPNDLVKVCINDNPNCCKILEFPVPDCTNPCGINDVKVLATPCLCGQFFAVLTFNHQNGGNGGFDVQGNGLIYGTYGYNHPQPVILGPLAGNGTTHYEFVVRDHNHPDCSNFYDLGTVMCGPLASGQTSMAEALVCSPNPATDLVQIYRKNGQLNLGAKTSVQIFAEDGKEVYFTDNQVQTNSFSIQIGHLPKGYYRILMKAGKEAWQGEFVKI